MSEINVSSMRDQRKAKGAATGWQRGEIQKSQKKTRKPYKAYSTCRRPRGEHLEHAARKGQSENNAVAEGRDMFMRQAGDDVVSQSGGGRSRRALGQQAERGKRKTQDRKWQHTAPS